MMGRDSTSRTRARGGGHRLVTLYCRSVLQNGRRALAVGDLLAGLYAYLYSLLRAEDYALLGGTLALFALLALAMDLTRRIDWSGGG